MRMRVRGGAEPTPQPSAVTRAFAASHGSDGPARRLLVVPAAAAVELNKVTTDNQSRSRPLPCVYSGVCGGHSLWVKRPSHSATGPSYCTRRKGLTPAMAGAHETTFALPLMTRTASR